MKCKRQGLSHQMWLSANDTRKWARQSGKYWPCSTLAGKRIYAEYWQGYLTDLRINGKYDYSCDEYELQAILDDFCGGIA